MGKLPLQKQVNPVYAIAIALVAMFITAAGVTYANHSTISSLKSQLSNKDQIIQEKDNLIQADAVAIGFRDFIVKDQTTEVDQLKSNLDALQNAKQAELQKILDEQKKAAQFKGGWTVTFYSLNTESTGKRPGESGYGLTASGMRVQEGVTIACPKFIQLGTQIEIQGYGVRTCQDRGGGVKGNTLDIYVANRNESELNRLGRQSTKIRIID